MAEYFEVNMGVVVRNSAPVNGTATIAATGVGRSGTTMISRVLSHLGVYMGETLTNNSHEDKDMQVLIKKKDLAGFKALGRKRDAQHDIWGFKCPALRGSMQTFCSSLRNPRVILTFRDILSIAIRNNVAVETEVILAMKKAISGYTAIIEEVEAMSCPILMVSYEKALQFPENTVRELAEFCGLKVSKDEVAEAAKRIVNGDEKYLRNFESAA